MSIEARHPDASISADLRSGPPMPLYRSLVPLLLLLAARTACCADFALGDGRHVARVLAESNATMELAGNLLRRDLHAVSGIAPARAASLDDCADVCIVIGRYDSPLLRELAAAEGLDFAQLTGGWERYIRVGIASRRRPGSRLLVVAGSDARGAVYGAVDLSRELGVSAWEWWADVKPAVRATIAVRGECFLSNAPSVRYRGVFLNDEDWGLQPWAARHDPSGDIGPETYARIFELLWRLKANLVWPAMHDVTRPFYQVPGNAEMAQDYAIVVGTSHAEPMMRNNVREWRREDGAFNFFSNRGALVRYWRERVQALRGFENIYTVGIRGLHDSAMEGAASIDAARTGVAAAIGVQRELLGPGVPQALTVYKEVLDIYNSGLRVPDDVTLVWPDDNYGYLHQLGTPAEARRSGGTGLYYHLSYWGRPHDYLWLATTHPGLIRDQLQRAVATGTDRLWVANVGDIKPGEYLTQYFLDAAFDRRVLERPAREHLRDWLAAQFGAPHADAMADVMMAFYALAWERRPEFMGFSQTEPTSPVRQTDYLLSGGDEAERRLARYEALLARAEAIGAALPASAQDAFFQLVLYPVRGAANLNARILKLDLAAQHARMGLPSAQRYADAARAAQAAIVADTARYNALGSGKWRGMMDAAPRRLPVFLEPLWPSYDGTLAVKPVTAAPPRDRIVTLDATAAQADDGWSVVDVGSSGSAMRAGFDLASRDLRQADAAPALQFAFDTKGGGAARLRIVAVPVHPLTSAHRLRVAAALDGQAPVALDFATHGRSDEWKKNVLSNTAVRELAVGELPPGRHELTIRGLDPGFILDRIEVLFDGAPVYYGRPAL
jgi:Glycosyl hydrolase family 115/Gylcosyl hydrolase family 115 C-terminal domain